MNERSVWGVIIIVLSVALGLYFVYAFYGFLQFCSAFVSNNSFDAKMAEAIIKASGSSVAWEITKQGLFVLILGLAAYTGAKKGTRMLKTATR